MGEVRKVLITGAAGYIGKQLCYHLKKGLFAPQITAIDRNTNGVKKLCQDGLVDVWYHYQDADGSRQLGHYDWVFHLAATSSVPAFDDDPIDGVMNTLQACHALGSVTFDKLIHASTAALQKDAESQNWYIMSKRLAENVLTKKYGNKVWHLRLHNVAGCIVESGYVEDHEPETHLIPNIVKRSIIDVYGDGTNRRDYIHVEDVCKALSSAALTLKPDQFTQKNDVYEVGTGRSYSVIEVIREYQGITGAGMGIHFKPGRQEPTDQRAYSTPHWLNWGDQVFQPLSLNTIIRDTIKGYENAKKS